MVPLAKRHHERRIATTHNFANRPPRLDEEYSSSQLTKMEEAEILITLRNLVTSNKEVTDNMSRIDQSLTDLRVTVAGSQRDASRAMFWFKAGATVAIIFIGAVLTLNYSTIDSTHQVLMDVMSLISK